MIESVFFDSNIYLYIFSRDPLDMPKNQIAKELLAAHAPVISSQVIQEFISAALKKKRLGITEEKIDLFLANAATFGFQPLTFDLILQATFLRRRYCLSHWDSAIVAAGHAAECSILYSEDLQHGFTLGGLTVINPFLRLLDPSET